MRILWLSVNNGLYENHKRPSKGYNGGGWISSLQKLLIANNENMLALAFITHTPLEKEKQNGTIYYPIYDPPKNSFQKLREYYGGYKKVDNVNYLSSIKHIIQDFKPDLIHLFGMENPLSVILGNTEIPVVVHLQGLLSPYDNAFFPIGFNKSSFLIPFSMNEWIFRNGYIYAKNSIHIRGCRELFLFKHLKFAMGRTEWDYQVSQLLAPQSVYFHVDEVLREPFYKNAGNWKLDKKEKFVIVSTLSNTVYKGLDVILKTAQLLKNKSNIQFKWQIIGIKPNDPIVRFFERKLHIMGGSVNVEYVGVLSADELCNKLLDSNVYVHPSYIDNSPNSLCEAQLLGMPVIGTFVGGVPSLIKNYENGLLVPANAPYELAYLLKRVYLEKDLLINLGKAAYNTASERHDKEKILLELMNVYRRIINVKSCKL